MPLPMRWMDYAARLHSTTTATPLSTPASSPCGTKYLSYSNIFFANFKEEQERILAEKLKQQQPTRLRTNTRLCRETAINNNNELAPQTSAAADNGNETANTTETLDNQRGQEECSLTKHVIKAPGGSSSSSGTSNATSQSKKIRITENPLPEPVSC